MHRFWLCFVLFHIISFKSDWVDLFILLIFFKTALLLLYYRNTSNISRTLVRNKIVDNSDVVGASPVSAAPTTSSFST